MVGAYMKLKKKYWVIAIIIVITLIRFLMSYHLPIFYLKNMGYDDMLMIHQSSYLLSGNYLGSYNSLTIVKGIFYPLILTIIRFLKLNYGVTLTLFYIFSCGIFSLSLKNIIKNKKILLLIYAVLLFNPISYSSDIYQRIYRSSLSITEIILFLSIIIRIIDNDKKIINYILLGIISSIMFLTREDSIYIIIALIILLIYNIYRKKNIKTIIINFMPIIILFCSLNIVSIINYQKYGVYSYNELQKSNFKDTYIKIMSIKDENDDNRFPISKNTLIKLSDLSENFNLSHEEIENYYQNLLKENHNKGLYYWYFRRLINIKEQFKNGDESEKYFKDLGREIDNLFKEGKLKKRIVIPSVLINTPTIDELKMIPKYTFDAIICLETYQNVRTFDLESLKTLDNIKYNNELNSYEIKYLDYLHSDEMINKNIYEIIRIIYMCFTIVFTIIAIIIFIKNIKKKDKLNIIIILISIIYIIILGGVTYSHATAFYAIRYMFLANNYILQSLFICLNLSRLIRREKCINYQ